MRKLRHDDIMVKHWKEDGYECREAFILKRRFNGWKWEHFTTDYGAYAAGFLPPNYPVPAIPVTIEWHHSPAHVAGVDTNYLNLFEGNNALARKQWGERMKHGEPETLEFYVWDCYEYLNYK